MKALVISALLAMMLGACSSNKVKEAPVTQAEGPSAAPAVVSEAPAAESAPAADSGIIDLLHHPDSILSQRNVYFGYDKYNIESDYVNLVAAHAGYLRGHPQASVVLEGHADERGTSEYNLALGQKRAVAVKKLMNLYGAMDSQIETISFGKEKPMAIGHDESAWSQNRRVDIRYTSEK